jgi:hypothetical protein
VKPLALGYMVHFVSYIQNSTYPVHGSLSRANV